MKERRPPWHTPAKQRLSTAVGSGLAAPSCKGSQSAPLITTRISEDAWQPSPTLPCGCPGCSVYAHWVLGPLGTAPGHLTPQSYSEKPLPPLIPSKPALLPQTLTFPRAPQHEPLLPGHMRQRPLLLPFLPVAPIPVPFLGPPSLLSYLLLPHSARVPHRHLGI